MILKKCNETENGGKKMSENYKTQPVWLNGLEGLQQSMAYHTSAKFKAFQYRHILWIITK